MDIERERTRLREYMRRKRAAAKTAGIELPCDTWWKRNPEKHRQKTRNWRKTNLKYSNAINARNQERRRSTPWGLINNRIWPIMHYAVRSNSARSSKYTRALGYLWSDLRAQLEAQFTPEMTWDNWGVVWELDHISPVSSFKYTSLNDPLFREAWALSNLRPLLHADNQQKGKRWMN